MPRIAPDLLLELEDLRRLVLGDVEHVLLLAVLLDPKCSSSSSRYAASTMPPASGAG